MTRTEYLVDYNLKNKEKIQEYNRKRYLEKKEQIREAQRKYEQTNIESIKIKKKIYRQKNKVKLKKYRQNYEQSHKPEIRKRKREYKKNRYHTDLNFRLKCNLRSRLWEVLKKNKKVDRTIKLLGCTLDELKIYLESKFTNGMNWDNYGKWHIDHIIPCDSFDFSITTEQKKCFHFSNLQPLWALDNLIKSANEKTNNLAETKS